ncbi:pyruvate kinase [Hippea maritima]|uniref:Pyruvate kinase n=1 Tax=Hippea maritima (strain ATCC 700847 / DSM 10411 / MH2) TaxID=760142 RepID=F2LUA8_HIPMA|nr:pyruvate kinase [Hippea maritima]AEA33434.1 pyruvate kinase [Hippea maritima DSM 10411]
MKRVKIVATVGPSTDSEEAIEELIKAGVDVFRLNFSHGDHDTHKKTIEAIRKCSKKLSKPTAILQDISGPKIRIGQINGVLELKKGDILILAKKKLNNDRYTVSVSHPEIVDFIKEGESVFFADGSIRTTALKKYRDYIELVVENEGVLSSRKGLNLPNSNIKISAITPKDERDLEFGAKEGVDVVAVSFVNSKEDILKAKEILKSYRASPKIVAKIETKKGVENIGEILSESDGLMVARGDLGIEVGLEKVPVIQKRLIKKANAHAKPVIVATQMLLSMVNSPYPTRAEVSDIANALLDGADAVMLSDETTIGKYPIKAVETLVRVILETQGIYLYYKKYDAYNDDAIAASVADLCKGMSPRAIISFTASGTTAKNIAKYRPDVPIYAITNSEDVLRWLSLVWGVEPFCVMKGVKDPETYIEKLKEIITQKNMFEKGDKLILTMGSIIGREGSTNMIRIFEV